MKGRHAAPGWSPFWRDILLRSILGLLLVAMAAFIWWLFFEDELFTNAVTTTSEVAVTGDDVPTTTEAVVTTFTEPTQTTAATTSSTQAPTSTTESSTTTTSTTIPPSLEPSELVVKVFNANGVAGIAGRVTARLEEAGYAVATPDNHSQTLDISRVWHREGLQREAQQLRETWIPDALVEPIPQDQVGVDITVILGRSFEE